MSIFYFNRLFVLCQIIKLSNRQVDEFIVSRFQFNKRDLLFVAKILKLNEQISEIHFMRRKMFVSFSDVLDEYEIDYKCTVYSITKSIDLRRNRFKFINLTLT